MVDYYELHMSPTSPHRAKAAVWLVAQTTPEDSTAKLADAVANGVKDKDDTTSTASSERKLPTIKEAEVIEDVRDFKARMPLSEGARPAKDLSEFEDLEPKL